LALVFGTKEKLSESYNSVNILTLKNYE